MCARAKTITVDQIEEILNSYSDIESGDVDVIAAKESTEIHTADNPTPTTAKSDCSSSSSTVLLPVSIRSRDVAPFLDSPQYAEKFIALQSAASKDMAQRALSIWLELPQDGLDDLNGSTDVEERPNDADDVQEGSRQKPAKRRSDDSDTSNILEKVLQRIRQQSLAPQQVDAPTKEFIPPWPMQILDADGVPICWSPVHADNSETSSQDQTTAGVSPTVSSGKGASTPCDSGSNASSDRDESEREVDDEEIDWADIHRISKSTASIERALHILYDDASSSEASVRLREVNSDEARDFLQKSSSPPASSSDGASSDTSTVRANDLPSATLSANASHAVESEYEEDEESMSENGESATDDEDEEEGSGEGESQEETSEDDQDSTESESSLDSTYESTVRNTSSTDTAIRHTSGVVPHSVAAYRRISRTLRAGPTHTPPLARAVRASRCSTFWAPGVRRSLLERRSVLPGTRLVREQEVVDRSAAIVDDERASRRSSKQLTPPSPASSSTSRLSRISLASRASKRRSMALTAARHYARPNIRATIYPRQTDTFWRNRAMNANRQARLTALFTGMLTIAEIEALDRQASDSLTQRRRPSISSTAKALKPLPPPIGPLPDVPLEADQDAELTPRARRMSVGSCSTIRASDDKERRRLMNLRRDPIRDSWITETDSVTSYCSWVSLTDGSTCSSSSSRPGRQKVSRSCLQCGPNVEEAKCTTQYTEQAATASFEAPPSSAILPHGHHQQPGVPQGWSREAAPAEQVRPPAYKTLPKLKHLSPFYIDAYMLWPRNVRESRQYEDALQKWSRIQQERMRSNDAGNRMTLLESIDEKDCWDAEGKYVPSYSASDPCSWCMQEHSDSCSLSHTPRASQMGRAGSPSGTSSSWTDSYSSGDLDGQLTPPRSEYSNPLVESPGRRLSQCLTPAVPRRSHWYVGRQSDQDTREKERCDTEQRSSRTGSLQVPDQHHNISIRNSAGSTYKPKGKRWILVDAEGKRITGGHHRDSSSTWRSASYNRGEESYQSSSGHSSTSSSSSWDSVDEETSSGQVTQARSMSCAPVARPASNMLAPLRTASPEAMTPERASMGTMRVFDRKAERDGTMQADMRPRSILKSAASRSTSNSDASIRFSDQTAAALARSRARSVSSAAHSSGILSRSSSYSLTSTLTANSARPVDGNARTGRERSNSEGSTVRLDKDDLVKRIQVERARNQRNNERLDTLDKLEGISKPSKVISSILKPVKVTRKDSIFSRMTFAPTPIDALSGHESEQRIGQERKLPDVYHGDDDALPITPLPETLDALKDLERQWQRTQVANDWKAVEQANKYANVTGFDIGLTPFSKSRGPQQPTLNQRRTYASGVNDGSNTFAPNDAKLGRDLQNSLRKLGMTVEAREAARQRYVDL